jgi:hypothetical protein
MVKEFFAQYFGVVLGLIVLALLLTFVVFRKRWFDRGYREGTAANSGQVKRENPPDRWSKSH